MSGDYTRLTFDPRSDHTGVRMQQGRVQLDSDWNELVDILERRARAATLDVLGPCAVPAETPQGFRITAAGGSLSIGPGRLYVDGLLVENHGDPESTRFDPLLGEVAGARPIGYDRQPYFPRGRSAPALPESGTAIAYLEAWVREVTAVEDPGLVERALGVDTATRLQTVWQVQVLPVADHGLTPAGVEATPEWRALVAQPAGRLSVRPVALPGGPEQGSFTGGENRLYRVEIHDPGDAELGDGRASFKWSSANGSAVAPVVGISTDGGLLQFAGRPGLTFAPGDWVEVLDDRSEWLREPGEMRQVAPGVDLATGRLPLMDALPPGRFDPRDTDRHTRVRRWDQKGTVLDADGRVYASVEDHDGVIPIPGDGRQLVLEDGIGVTFSAGAHPAHHRQPGRRRVRIEETELLVEVEGRVELIDVVEVEEEEEEPRRRRRRHEAPPGRPYRCGDFWTFAARTDGWLEGLDQAPPRGIHRHFCPLAVVMFPSTAVDCRVVWPRDSLGAPAATGCAVSVTAAGHAAGAHTVQHAVDGIRTTGGTVCLGPGVYTLDEPLDLSGARSLRLAGAGWATVLLHRGPEPAIGVSRAMGLTIEDLTVVAADPGSATGAGPSSAARRRPAGSAGSAGETWAELSAVADRYQGTQACVIALSDSVAVGIHRCNLVQLVGAQAAVPAVGLQGVLLGVTVTGSTVLGAAGVGNQSLVGTETGPYLVATAEAHAGTAQVPYLLTAGLAVEDNELWCARRGVSLEGLSLHASETRIARNRISGCSDAGIALTGFVGSGANLRGHRVVVEGNRLQVDGDGIVVGTDRGRVAGNDVAGLTEVDFAKSASIDDTARAPVPRGQARSGIVIARGLRLDRTDGCAVSGNQVENVAGHGVLVEAPVGALLVEGNTVSGAGRMGVEMAAASSGKRVTVRNNRLEDVIAIAHDAPTPVAAIRLRQADSADVSGNTVQRVGQTKLGTAGRGGIQLQACRIVRVAGNDLREFGVNDGPQPDAAGIDVAQPFDEAHVADNVVRLGTKALPGSAWRALRIPAPTAAQAHALLRAAEPRAVQAGAGILARILQRRPASARRPAATTAASSPAVPAPEAQVSVRGNLLEAAEPAAAVEIDVGGPCTFSANRCLRPPTVGTSTAVVSLSADSAIFIANHVGGTASGATAVSIVTATTDGVAATADSNVVPGGVNLSAQEQGQ